MKNFKKNKNIVPFIISALAVLLLAVAFFNTSAPNTSTLSENEFKPVVRQDMATWNSNTIEIALGKFETTFRSKWVNYLDEDNTWKAINPEFVQTQEGWVVKDAPFIAIAPVASNGIAYFISNNRWDLFDEEIIDAPTITQSIQALKVNSVEGMKESGDLGFGETTYIIYQNAYPDLNADLIYWVYQGKAPRLEKLVRFNTPLQNDERIDFRIRFATEDGSSITVNNENNKTLAVKLANDESRRGISLKDVEIWDAQRKKVEVIDTELVTIVENEEYVLTKTVPASFFEGAQLPVYTDTTSTFYPDPDTETNTVDGPVRQIYSVDSGVLWSTIIADAGTSARPSDADSTVAYFNPDTDADKWKQLHRGIFLFDTSSIADTDTIDSATLSLYGSSKDDQLSQDPEMDVNIYSSSPASNTDLVGGDFDSLGSTAFSTAIGFTAFSTAGYNDFVLNANGLAQIKRSGEAGCASTNGLSCFGGQNENYDVDGVVPTNGNSGLASRISIYYADETGTTKDPKLVVTHTVPFTPKIIIY